MTPSVSPSPPADLSLPEKVAGLLVVGFRGAALTEAAWLRDAIDDGLGGVILFDRDQLTGADRNIRSEAQVAALTADLQAAAGRRQLIVAIDQEGGLVTRLSPRHGFPAVASEADIGAATTAETRAWADTIATTLESVGITLNLAPVVDLDVNPDSPAIGRLGRAFGADPAVVVEKATIEIEAHRVRGIATTLKHFPGIGSSTTNTDFGVADVSDTWTDRELEPFRRLIAAGTADVVMAGHVVNRRLDPELPASLSGAVVEDLLRSELGWTGPVITDDLQAAAIDDAFGFDEAVILALEAGNDLLLFANQQSYDDGLVDRVVAVVTGAVDSGRLPAAIIDDAWARLEPLRRA